VDSAVNLYGPRRFDAGSGEFGYRCIYGIYESQRLNVNLRTFLEDTPRLQIRQRTFGSFTGWAVSGTDVQGRRVNIFAKTREGAEAIRDAVIAGDHEAIDGILLAGR
jgi:hypothetical protein